MISSNDALKALANAPSTREDRMRLMAEQRQRNQAEMIARGLVSIPGQNASPVAPAVPIMPIPSNTPVPKPINPEPMVLNPAHLSLEDLQKELLKRKEELNKKVELMVLDANAYRVNAPSIRLLTEDKTAAERLKYAGNIAIATNVPIVIVLSYLGEMYGFYEELDNSIKKLMDFYTVSEILNVKK